MAFSIIPNQNPYGSFGFRVNLKDAEGHELGCFQEASGLSIQVGVEDMAEGGLNSTTHKVITGTSYANIVLKRGLCSADMYGIIEKVVNAKGNITRIDGSIDLLDDAGNPIKTFSFVRGIPVKWDGPSLSVMSDAIATESLEIAHEGLTVSTPKKS